MTEKKTRLIFVQTVPHTGTHTLFKILSATNPELLHIEGIHQGINDDEVKIKTGSYIKEYINDGYNLDEIILKLKELFCCMNAKVFGLYEHIAMPGTPPYEVEDFWIYDLKKSGVIDRNIHTISTIRKPEDTILSILISTADNLFVREKHLNWIYNGYKYLADNYDPEYFHLIPIGLTYSLMEIYYSVVDIFEKILGVDYNRKFLQNIIFSGVAENKTSDKINRIYSAIGNKQELDDLIISRYTGKIENPVYKKEIKKYYNDKNIATLLERFKTEYDKKYKDASYF